MFLLYFTIIYILEHIVSAWWTYYTMVLYCLYGRSDHISLLILGCQSLQLPSWVPFSLSRGSVQLPCPQDTQAPCGEAHVAGKRGLHPAAGEQLRPANNHMSLEVFKWPQPQLTASLQPRERPWARISQLSCSQESITTTVAKHLNILQLDVQSWRSSCRSQEISVFP